jgi:hypothetical protein
MEIFNLIPGKEELGIGSTPFLFSFLLRACVLCLQRQIAGGLWTCQGGGEAGGNRDKEAFVLVNIPRSERLVNPGTHSESILLTLRNHIVSYLPVVRVSLGLCLIPWLQNGLDLRVQRGGLLFVRPPQTPKLHSSWQLEID